MSAVLNYGDSPGRQNFPPGGRPAYARPVNQAAVAYQISGLGQFIAGLIIGGLLTYFGQQYYRGDLNLGGSRQTTQTSGVDDRQRGNIDPITGLPSNRRRNPEIDPITGQPTYGGTGQSTSGGTGQPTYGGTGQPTYGGTGQPTYGGTGQPTYGGTGQPTYGGGSSQYANLRVRAQNLNMRQCPGFNCYPIFQLPYGTTVTALGEQQIVDNEEWLRVRYGNMEGWVSRYYLE